ncbi:bifunctional diaminohydroxyphosphoribosylaminopyrimidine deaminase/5-amino-6-(5-phosphoribosylamino)uracil reductase RibD [uncultured Alsobacter sp.]|uniref:bifunctional diaminohydroxyphosphoribosylaminopyrimidine deaminase/5-amino-6-(5-phosphoribosylamino)uracil reductase RibD n=1 Tax=uncultured Alsobacter sp. TaxID=1748258 RepID=UPI0025DC9515|nr:bifunctional diaminohydroxyphosphoribosylaminopyrimidine deaminase/5-amino-6-(5-phosphoribosylamino)uracil reductase RibD [uncultured Alsobacter sp.]
MTSASVASSGERRLSPQEQTAVDERMMRHALALARRGLGNTWPNPAVGAVIWRMTDDGPVVVGRGFTQPGGRPHAETVALAQAGEAARGASIAVTLEPCSHHGKTPPCSGAILQAGIRRVVSAIEDPDPRVNGRGHIMLRANGVEVVTGVLAREARRGNFGFIRKVVDGRPSVTLKLARTADGFAAGSGPERLMITGPQANARVHMLRAQHDAILVGAGTVMADDPLLTCRLPGLEDQSPVRVVLDSALALPADRRVFTDRSGPATWVMTGADASWDSERTLVGLGIGVERVRRTPEGLDLRGVLGALASRGITRLFCEGGPRLGEALARLDLVDDLVLLTGPEPLGAAGLPALGPILTRIASGGATHEPALEADLGRDRLQLFTRRI